MVRLVMDLRTTSSSSLLLNDRLIPLRWSSLQRSGCCLTSSEYHPPQTQRRGIFHVGDAGNTSLVDSSTLLVQTTWDTLTEAPLSIITRPSWVLGPTPWLLVHGFLGPNPWLFPFFKFIRSATTLAQVYDIDFVFNRVNVLPSRRDICIFDLNFVHHLVMVCS